MKYFISIIKIKIKIKINMNMNFIIVINNLEMNKYNY